MTLLVEKYMMHLFHKNYLTNIKYLVDHYLQSTKYACDGASGFFAKLIATGQTSGGPAFLSTHPDPGNRVTKITERADELGCSKALHHDDTSASGDNGAYAAMLATLPQ